MEGVVKCVFLRELSHPNVRGQDAANLEMHFERSQANETPNKLDSCLGPLGTRACNDFEFRVC